MAYREVSKGPGRVIIMPDGRRGIVYNRQPARKDFGVIIIHLVGEDLKPVTWRGGKPRCILKKELDYTVMMAGSQIIGYVD